jgi:exonuclease SbcD
LFCFSFSLGAMTFAHLSDTHLGYRSYSRTTPLGFNQREVDVMKTFKRCLDAIAERDPDIVVHSGDLFHVVRPSNATILGAFKALSEFQNKRKAKPFILIGGNHDTPRVVESGNILHLFAEIPGVFVQLGGALAFPIDSADLEVLCVPSNSLELSENIEWAPQLGKRHSLLTMHGLANNLIKDAGRFDIAHTRADRWTYVALGDFHEHKAYGDNICYAGSTDFTSTNIWEEIKTPKGWVWFDTERDGLEFVGLPTRRVIDLPKIDARDMTSDAIIASLKENAQWDSEEMPIVRQMVYNVHPDTRGQIGSSIVRDLNATCLNYLLRLLPPQSTQTNGEYKRPESFTLETSWDDHIATAELPANVHRAQIKELGSDLLKEVKENVADPSQA